MERQWDIDSRSPEFACLRKAWRKNISGLWNQICSQINTHQNLAGIFETIANPSDSIVENVDFTGHSNMEDVFMNYSTKPTSQLEPVDENPIELDGFLNNPNAIPRNKENDEISYLPEEARKKTHKKKVNYVFPEDFRHYKYLPV